MGSYPELQEKWRCLALELYKFFLITFLTFLCDLLLGTSWLTAWLVGCFVADEDR